MLQQGIVAANEAVALKEQGDEAGAQRRFGHAGQFFKRALNDVKNPEERALIHAQMIKYTSAAEKARPAQTRAEPEAAATFSILDRPETRFKDVIGQAEAKRQLSYAILLPSRFPSLKRVAPPPSAILLFGPPGTGKTLLARALAGEAGLPFFPIQVSEVVTKWVGDSEKNIAALFKQARDAAPSIIFIDEVDALTSARKDDENEASRRVKSQLLTSLDGIVPLENVLLIGATNHPECLDAGFRRRFVVKVHVPLPSAEDRFDLLEQLLESKVSVAELREVAQHMDGYSAADVVQAARVAMSAVLDPVYKSRFFRKEPSGLYQPLGNEPPCPDCPMLLSSDSVVRKDCQVCGTVHVKEAMHLEPGSDFVFEPLQAHNIQGAATVTKEEAEICTAWARQFS